ncbi:hypothetical protein ACTHRH_24360 [Paenibacillus sp. SAFN-117]
MYGNDSPYGAVNEELFPFVRTGRPDGSPAVLITSIMYETRER